MGMKRFVLLAMLAMTWWCVPAFGAESIRILRNGEEVRLVCGSLFHIVPVTRCSSLSYTTSSVTLGITEPKYIDGIGYSMSGLWEGLLDGKWTYSRRLYCALPAGKYRIGIPFFAISSCNNFFISSIVSTPCVSHKYFRRDSSDIAPSYLKKNGIPMRYFPAGKAQYSLLL